MRTERVAKLKTRPEIVSLRRSPSVGFAMAQERPARSGLYVVSPGGKLRADLPGALSSGLADVFGLVTEPNPGLQRAIDAFRHGELSSADPSELALQIESPAAVDRPCGGFWRRCLLRLKVAVTRAAGNDHEI